MRPSMDDVETLYRHRFSDEERAAKDALWRVLCRRFLQRRVRPEDSVLDLACGYGEFSRHIVAARKHAVDLNPDAAALLPPGTDFHVARAESMGFLPDGGLDVVFTSNFLEHLPDKPAVDAVLAEVHRVLKPGGRFLLIQPNVRYASAEYWDFWDHHVALSHLSCAEALRLAGFTIEECVPRFLPFSTKSALPASPLLLEVYLFLRPAWRLFGKQFFMVARKPEASR
jgi:SAM-dependent methyltransferase